MHDRKFLMMGIEDARNMQNFITEYILIISASGWLFKNKSTTMHGNMNAKYGMFCLLPGKVFTARYGLSSSG